MKVKCFVEKKKFEIKNEEEFEVSKLDEFLEESVVEENFFYLIFY